MPKTKAQKGQRKLRSIQSGFVTSEKSVEILEIIQQSLPKINNREMTKADLYRKVKKIDGSLPAYPAFLKFLSHLDDGRKKRTAFLLQDLQQSMINEVQDGDTKVMKQFVNMVYSKIFSAGNAVISQELEDIKIQVENGLPLSENQKKNVMQWFFKGVEGMQKDRALDISLEAGERAQSFMDTLMQGFQYGKIKRNDIVEGEIVPPNSLKPANVS